MEELKNTLVTKISEQLGKVKTLELIMIILMMNTKGD